MKRRLPLPSAAACHRCYDDLMQMGTQLLNKILCIKYIYWIPCEKEHYAFVFTADYAFLILNSNSHSDSLIRFCCCAHKSFSICEYFEYSKAFIQITSHALLLYCSMHKNGINLNVICKVGSLAWQIFKTEFGRCFCDSIIWLYSSAEIDSAQCAARIFITNGTMAF